MDKIETKVALINNMIHVLVPSPCAGVAEPHGIYSMPINTFQSFTGITVRMMTRGVLDYQVEDKIWEFLPVPASVLTLFSEHAMAQKAAMHVGYRECKKGIYVAALNPAFTGFFWAAVIDDQAQGLTDWHVDGIIRTRNLLAQAVIELGTELNKNFDGEIDSRRMFPGLYASKPVHDFTGDELADAIGHVNPVWDSIDKNGRIEPQPASEYLSDRPLRDIKDILCKLGMHEGDALTFADNLGKAGLSTGTDLHNEIIRDIRGLLVNKIKH